VDVLNLGAGNKIEPNAVNHDLLKHRPEIDVAWDLGKLRWPWPDDSFDLIIARSVLEHVKPSLLETLGECWRILRPAGRIFVKLPHWQHDRTYSDPTHYWQGFSLGIFDQFDPDTERGREYSFYTTRKWRIIERPAFNEDGSSFMATLEVRK
jgi:SAM-dependent methyltransferase